MIPIAFIQSLATAATPQSGSATRWLLGLDRINPNDSSVVFEWASPLPSWLWLAIVIMVLAAAGHTYRRLLGNKAGRMTLAASRCVLLLMIILLLAGPTLVLPRESVEEDRVLLLLDESQSMAVADAPDPASPAARITRADQLRGILTANTATWDELAEDHRLDWLAFSDRIVPLESPGALAEPTGPATALRTALTDATLRAAGKPIGGVIIFSDGRSSQTLDASTLAYLGKLGVEVWTVPLGSDQPPLDLAIRRVDAPDRAFVNDTVPITVRIGRNGVDPANPSEPAQLNAPPGTRIRITDQLTSQVLDEQPVTRLDQPVRLLHTPEAAGQTTWIVELVTAEPDLAPLNNRASIELELTDRKIRLLYVDAYPRWEYRYLKNLILREPSIESSIMLVSADRDFAQEGTLPLQRLPRTDEEMADFDVIIIGDVPGTFFSSQQQKLIDQQVAQRGAGLMWIAGPQSTPLTYVPTTLAPLLPLGTIDSARRLQPPIQPVPTQTAESLGVMRLLDLNDPDQTRAAATWPDDLPPLVWAQAIEDLKPATEVLAFDQRSGYPLVMRMRYGGGQTMYVATDETWRWRYGRGELYRQQFWMQMVRLLARGRLQSGVGDGQRAAFTVSRRRVAVNQPVSVELHLADQSLVEAADSLTQIAVEITPANSSTGPNRTAQSTQSILLTRTDRTGRFQGQWIPINSGRANLTVTEPILADLGLSEIVTVDRDDAEMRYPAADHDLLKQLAESTGGQSLTPDQISDLPQLIANRASHTTNDIREPLTHSPLIYIVFVVLLMIEWIGRRIIGLA